MSRLKLPMTSQRVTGLALAIAVVGLVAGVGADASPAVATQAAAASPAAAASAHGRFTRTEKISRVNLINGKNQVVDARTFTATVDQTRNLRDRQTIDVSWTGAHPTRGIFANQTSEQASEEEYPVVLMMCRGAASASSGKHLITPETCWTQTPAERVQVDSGSYHGFPPYRLDRYASTADRGPDAGVPARLPKNCSGLARGNQAQHWVPFVAASGHVYDFGPQGCAGLPPEATANTGSIFEPSNTTYSVANLKGDGSARFVINTAQSNTSLGCSSAVACALVIIPIMGISCDPSGNSLPPADRPPSDVVSEALTQCSETGFFGPGSPQTPAEQGESDLAVRGQLWWSPSNWRNRIMVPLTFAPPTPGCPTLSNSAPALIYGSYLLGGATQQWVPYLCTHRNPFQLQQVLTVGDPQAKLELQAGSIDAAFEGSPPQVGQTLAPFTGHVVQAPTAVTGFGIVFDIVNKFGHQYTKLRLDARLLAKLLTESYPENNTIAHDDKALQNPITHKPNPENITDDPEFQALNPGIPAGPPPKGQAIGDLAAASAATIQSLNTSSDAMWALTSYINADPEARAWLNGKPDPWGMVVNPAYKHIQLPTAIWPLRDTYVPVGLENDNDPCMKQDPVPYLNNVAEPTGSMANITLDLEFGISASQTNCNFSSGVFASFQAVGQEIPGATFILGFTSLADADQYGLPTAALETQGGSTSDRKFATSAGRSFAVPSNASVRAAAAMMEPDDTTGSWTVPYAKMRTASAGKAAYPGTMLISTDVPTHGLPKAAASDYGSFLSFVAEDGQHSGLGNGQLPPGYLPMTAANGEAKMVAYTKAAAADVRAQNSQVPSPTNPHSPSTPSPSSSPTPTPGSSSSGSSTSGSSGSGSSSPGTGGSASPSAGTSTPTTSPGPQATQRLTLTGDIRSAISGAILPLVLLIALIAATVAFGVWQFTRPTEPK